MPAWPGSAFYVFLVQFSLAPRPFLSPRLFTDTNFVVGLTLYFTNGMIMYATLALLAPYLQTLMNYPVVTAGLVLAPRGAGPGGRRPDLRPDARQDQCTHHGRARIYNRCLGVVRDDGLDTDVSEWTIVRTGFIQGISLGFITIPINIITFATLPSALRTEGTGIYSLVRNLGSAIGISVTGALLQINTQVNHAYWRVR